MPRWLRRPLLLTQSCNVFHSRAISKVARLYVTKFIIERKIIMGKIKKRYAFLAISLALMLLGSIFASLIQSNFGSVVVKEINWITDNGYSMNGWLFIPANATTENPAPAVVTSHGMFNNKGMQDLNFVELARRGFVVLAQDMPSHGDSDDVDGFVGTLTGLYESVKELAEMPFVDSSRIGITGHSLGGMSCNTAVTLDNYAATPLIAAVLLNSADATYTDTNGFANIYGSRDVGIIAGQYDEWFFDDVDANGDPTLPKDFIYNKNAQSILYFGKDPAGLELRKANTFYTETVDGETAHRVIYTPAIIHPWSHFSYRSTVGTIEFFDKVLDAPIDIAPTNQIWQWKVVANAAGLIGFFIFMVSLTLVLIKLPFFSDLSVETPVAPRPVSKAGKFWFFGALILGSAFAALVYFPILTVLGASAGYIPGIAQSSPNGVGFWAAACGLFGILSMVVSYFLFGKKNGLDLSQVGVKLPLKKLGKTVLLAAIVLIFTVGSVFVADYLFMADFRIWVLAVRAFKMDQLGYALLYAPLFLLYYVANSVAGNCFNYNDIGVKDGKGKWLNLLLVALSAVLPAIVLLLMQYIPYFAGSDLLWPQNNMYGVWLFPMLVILPGAAVVSRIIYKQTKNPYLPGIICGILVAIISCSNTLTMIG